MPTIQQTKILHEFKGKDALQFTQMHLKVKFASNFNVQQIHEN
jgi:hypothetical protein